MLLLAAHLALATSPEAVSKHGPRTHTAAILLHTGTYILGAGAVTSFAGMGLALDPFVRTSGCTDGQQRCGVETFGLGLAMFCVGTAGGASALPLVVAGLAMPREKEEVPIRPRVTLSILPGGLRVSGTC